MLRPTEKADMTDCTELLRLTPEERLLREYFPAPEAQIEARRRLADGEPLAYILGEWSFYGEVYTVTPDVLIPRSDTEILVERLIRDLPQNGRFLDLCTGSGCVAISVAAHRPDLTCVAVDISAAALDIARKNAARNGVTERIRFVRGDVLGDLPDAGDGVVDDDHRAVGKIADRLPGLFAFFDELHFQRFAGNERGLQRVGKVVDVQYADALHAGDLI